MASLHTGARPVVRPEDLGLGPLFPFVRDPVLVFDTQDGRLVLTNPAAARLFPTPLPPGGGALATQIPHHPEELSASPVPLKVTGPDGIDVTCEARLTAANSDGRSYLVAVVEDPVSSARQSDLQELAEIRAPIGEHFFTNLARVLSRALGVDYVLIGELISTNRVRTSALNVRGEPAPPMEYTLSGTPAENVVGREFCHYTSGVQALFPGDRELAALGVDSYMGVPLFDGQHQPIGLIVLMHREPIREPDYARSLLRIAAARAETELERARIDRERQQHSASLEAILRQMPAGVVIAEAPSGRVLLANDEAEPLLRSLGAQVEELTDYERFTGYRQDGSPYKPDEWPLVRALVHGETVSGEEVDLERGDGERTVLSVSAGPIRDQSNRTIAAVATFFDITERRHAGDLLRRGARHSALRADIGVALGTTASLGEVLQLCAEAIVRHLDAAFARIWTLNEQDQVLELQASAGMYTHLDGAHGRVPVGKFKIGLIAEERLPHLTNQVVDDPRVGDQAWAKREGMVAFAGYPLVVEDRLVGVLAMFSRAPLPKETLEALESVAVAVAQGIERKRQEEELRRSNAELEQFAYVASHDLQEPLRVVVSYLQLLERRYGGQLDERGEKYIRYTVGAAERMKRLINDLLTYSRAGRQERAIEQVDCNVLLGSVLDDLRAAIEESGGRITHDPLPIVRAEPAQLSLVFRNLIGNALKFRGEAPPDVHVTVQPSGPAWHFSVIDNGIGIDAQFKERIFVLFQRLHGRADYPGTGIGLALAKKIVERHGGRIWVESAPGAGSTFHFTLPAARGF